MLTKKQRQKFLDQLYSLLKKVRNEISDESSELKSPYELDEFLQKKLKDYNKYYYAKIIYTHMDEILNHCCEDSLGWATSPLLIRYSGYPEMIYQFIIHYKEPKKIPRLLFYDFGAVIEVCPEVARMFNSKRFVDDLIDLNLDGEIYCDVIRVLDCETQMYFIDRTIEEQITLPYYANITDYYECYEYIKSRRMDIVKYTTSCFELRRACEEEVDDLNQYFEEHPEVVFNTIRERIRNILLFGGNKEIDENILDIALMVIEEVMQSDDAKVSELDSSDAGCYSFVIVTKTKAIKVGYERRTVDFPDNPYIVTPLIRRDISTDKTSCFIEVTERVELVSRKELEGDGLYGLYKNLRDLGIIWTDIKANNVGRLLKDNTVHWDKPIAHELSNLSLTERKGDIVLKAGDLVLLDADYLFDKDSELDVPTGSTTRFKKFTERYESELKHKEGNSNNGIVLIKNEQLRRSRVVI